MLESNRQIEAQLGPNQKSTQILKEFYSLHYPNKKYPGPEQKKLRTNSVMAVNQHYNPQIDTQQQIIRRKRSLAEKVSHQNESLAKSKQSKPKQKQFSFKQMLSGKEDSKFIPQYFTQCPPKYVNSLQELSNHNSNIRNAIQKCKNEKLKISKVLASQKQSQDTKLDYLQLKRKEVQQQKNSQIKAIYNEFFRKQYQQLYGDSAYREFFIRISQTVQLFHNKIFAK